MRDLRGQLTEAEAAEIAPNLCGAHPDHADVTCRDCLAIFMLRELVKMRAIWKELCKQHLEETRPRLVRRKNSHHPNELSR